MIRFLMTDHKHKIIVNRKPYAPWMVGLHRKGTPLYDQRRLDHLGVVTLRPRVLVLSVSQHTPLGPWAAEVKVNRPLCSCLVCSSLARSVDVVQHVERSCVALMMLAGLRCLSAVYSVLKEAITRQGYIQRQINHSVSLCLSVCLCYMSVYLSVSVCVICLSVSVCLCLCLSLSRWLCLSLSTPPPSLFSLCLCLSVFLCLSFCFYFSVCLFLHSVYVFSSRSLSVSMCFSVSVSLSPFLKRRSNLEMQNWQKVTALMKAMQAKMQI